MRAFDIVLHPSLIFSLQECLVFVAPSWCTTRLCCIPFCLFSFAPCMPIFVDCHTHCNRHVYFFFRHACLIFVCVSRHVQFYFATHARSSESSHFLSLHCLGLSKILCLAVSRTRWGQMNSVTGLLFLFLFLFFFKVTNCLLGPKLLLTTRAEYEFIFFCCASEVLAAYFDGGDWYMPRIAMALERR